jgi:uncharacterized Zn finger protein (UPF0148 family)
MEEENAQMVIDRDKEIATLTQRVRELEDGSTTALELLKERLDIVIKLTQRVKELQDSNDRLSRYQATCHCGSFAKDHGYTDNHSAVPMIETCPYAERVKELEADNKSLAAHPRRCICGDYHCPVCGNQTTIDTDFEAVNAKYREALEKIAAQDSGEPGSTKLADCLAAYARQALKED